MTEFDYIIIGGRPSGLTIANRLSELPNITIAVIEVGGESAMPPTTQMLQILTVIESLGDVNRLAV